VGGDAAEVWGANEAARRALDEHWWGQLTARAELEAVVAMYVSWLREVGWYARGGACLAACAARV